VASALNEHKGELSGAICAGVWVRGWAGELLGHRLQPRQREQPCDHFLRSGAPTGSCTKTVFTSTNITDNNETSYLDQTPVVSYPSSTSYNCGSGGDTLPPFSMTTYTYSTGGSSVASIPAPTSSQNPSVYGQAVTLTATLTGTSTAPTGSVTFVNGSTSIGNATLIPGGGLTSTATLTTSALPTGTDPIVVTYGSTSSPTLNEVVNQGGAAATVASSLSSTVYGQATTLTATLTGLYAAPTGPVVFMDGATTIATVSLTAGAGLSSTAALTTSTLPVGTHAITVSYAATTNFGAATSPVLSQVVNPSATTGTVTSTLTPSSFGQSVTLVATVSSGYAAPTGSVTFMNGATAIGSVTLTPGGGLSSSASLNTSTLPMGTDSITVVYGATANFGGSTSAVLTQVVKPPSTTSTVASSVNPASIGQSVLLTATVSSGGAAPTGSVTFMDGSTAIGTATLAPGSGLSSTATLTTSTLPTGTDAITVVYATTANFGGSTSAVLNQIVSPATTTAAVASSLNPAGSGVSVTLTATISSSYAAPIGSVTFKNGATSLGTATLSPGSGLSSTATLAITTLPGGTNSITVVYAATPNFGASTSGVLSQVVNAPATTATVVSSLNPSSYDQPVTFTATLSSSNAAPTGSVTFMQGATAIGSGTLASSGGLSSTATLITSALPVGTDPITVVYAATPNFGASTSAVLSQVVNPDSTAAAVTTSLNPSSSSQPVILTATLTSGYAAPTGSVTFMEGSTALGSATLTASGGLSSTATLITSTLPVGSDPITVVYAATADFGAVTSAVFSQVVNPATSTTATVTSSLDPASAGQSVILTATLVGLFAPPTGSVVFMDGSTTIGSGTLTATGSLSSTATLVISALPVGTDPITAVYAATPNFGAATSAVFSQVVTNLISATALSVSPNPASVGQTVTLTAAVGGSSTSPSGTVTFYYGTASLGSATLGASGNASITTASLPVGTDTLTAVFSGSAIYSASTSPTVTESIQAAASQDFTVALASPSVTIATENNTTTSVAISSVNGFADTVNLSCGSLPTYITCSLTPSAASLAANGAASSVLYIDTSSVLGYARNNSGPLGRGGSPFNLALMLSPMGLFAGIAVFPTRRSRRFPRLRLLVLLLATIPVTLAFSGCASPSVISAGGTPLSAAAGTYTIPITATGSSTGISHTVNLTLTVTP
jgi:hypothetical protein